MKFMLAVALGGALGSVSRLWMGQWVGAWLGRGFPFGTLSVNILGSLAMGVLFGLLVERAPQATEARALFMVGFLGAFTTFSTFSMDTVVLILEGALVKAIGNVLANVTMSIGAAYLGLLAVRHLLIDGM